MFRPTQAHQDRFDCLPDWIQRVYWSILRYVMRHGHMPPLKHMKGDFPRYNAGVHYVKLGTQHYSYACRQLAKAGLMYKKQGVYRLKY